MRYSLRTLLLVGSLLGIAFGVFAFPVAWQLIATHPGIQLPGLHVLAGLALFGGVVGLISWVIIMLGSGNTF